MKLLPLFFSFFSVLLSTALCERLHCPKDSIGYWPPNRINTASRLIWLRKEMNRPISVRGPSLDAFIITSHDEHQSEFLSDPDQRLQYISGFSGIGYAVVTRSKAALWTDYSYYDQADQQLDCNWILMKQGEPGVPSLTEWLRKEFKSGYRVGADQKLIPASLWDEWNRDLAIDRIVLTEAPGNVLDESWTINRPVYNKYPAFILPLEYAGETWQSKISMLRQNLSRLECDAIIVTALEEIAWLLNIRGRDLPYNPFIRSYLIINRNHVRWYVDKAQISDQVRRQLKMDNFGPYTVKWYDYKEIFNDIRTESQSWKKALVPGACVFSSGASQAILSAVPPEKRLIKPSPVIFMKAKKNINETDGMRRANIRDSAVLVDFLANLDNQVKKENLTELTVAKSLDQARLNHSDSQGIAFPTVVAFGSNGALLRYEPTNYTDKKIDQSSTLILESGGHYYDGTTDVIRTLHFGTPRREMIEAYTHLLSSIIHLLSSTFPSNVKTSDVDLILRSKLWKSRISYRQDSGHGIGIFSNIKESPILLNYDVKQHKQTFKDGYFFTCEPSYSKANDFGVKLGLVLEVTSYNKTNDEKYLGFKEVTLVPFESKLIDPSMLSKEEIMWLNQYNARTMQEVGAELKRQSKMKAFHWLMEKTKEIPYSCNSSKSWKVFPSFMSILTVVYCLRMCI